MRLFLDPNFAEEHVVEADFVASKLQSLRVPARPLRLLYFGRLVADKGVDRIEVPLEVEERWGATMEKGMAYNRFVEHGQYFGANVPGKPRRFLLNPAGRPSLLKVIGRTVEGDFPGFFS